MRRLIVPLDGSRPAEAALHYGVHLAGRQQAQLVLVHVLEQGATAERSNAERYLHDLVTRHTDGIAAETHVLRGNPVDAILTFLGENRADLLVLSRNGRTSLLRNRADSVALRVIRQSTIPVLLIDEVDAEAAPDLDEILVPLDGSALAESALPLAIEIIGKMGRLCLVRVVLPVEDSSGETIHHETAAAIDEARAALLQVAIDLRQHGVNVTWEIRFGDPASEILRAAETAGVRGIAMATRGLSGQRPWTFGSVTESVIRAGKLPIIMIPPPA